MNFSIFNWNIQGTKYYTSTNFDKVAPALKKADADIFCLQEAQELIKRLSSFDRLKVLNYAFSDGGQGRNIILSKLPIISSGELTFPSFTNRPLEKALWADIKIGNKIVRIYNCHFEIFGVGPKERADQLKFVLADSKKQAGPVIICGDLNTTIPSVGIKRRIIQWFHKEPNESIVIDGKYFRSDERFAFVKVAEQEGFREALDISKSTWCVTPFGWELFNLKLDWFLVRDITTPRISLGDYISDHRAIFAECSF